MENGREISVWNMEDIRMEWSGRFQEWNERQSSILPYQFHIRFRTWHLPKNIYAGVPKQGGMGDMSPNHLAVSPPIV